MTERIGISVPKEARRTRLEEFLFDQFPGLSRMYLRRIVRNEKCEVNGRLENVGFRVRGGDFVEVELDPSRENSMRPENVPLELIYEDEHLAVVSKPCGMLVHPTNRDKNGTLLNALVFHFNVEPVRNAECRVRNAKFVGSSVGDDGLSPIRRLENRSDSALRTPHSAFGPDSALRAPHSAFASVIRPGLVHRLDKQTSGLMVIAKSVRVHRGLARQFQRKLVEKKYLALVDGVVNEDGGTIEAAIGRYAAEKRWDLKPGAKHSETRFRVLERNTGTTLLELEPVTGRTNQLRIHCAAIGHPIVGDTSRGGTEFHRLCLHAWKLSFKHPIFNSVHLFEQRLEFLPHTNPTEE